MINKKGSTTTFINAELLLALIAVIVFVIWISGGGASVIFNIANIMRSIPAWVYIAFAAVWLLASLRK